MPRSVKEILVEAFRRGRAWDPEYPNLQNLDLARVQSMDGDEVDAGQLVASLQKSDLNMETLVQAFHQRFLDPNGEVGPATQALVDLPRCPIPDFAPPPNASFHYDDPDLQRVVETMQANAQGSGSWPSCDPQSPGVNSFRVRLNTSGMPSTIQAYHLKALEAVVACYAEMGCALRYILAASGDCELSKIFKGLAGSTIGMNEFPTPDTCDQTISGWLDPDYAPSDWRYWANLEAHETGHGVGLQHTRGHIMNPSILLIWPLSWKGGPSESTMVRYFGGVPINPPAPGPGQVPEFHGELTGDHNSIGEIAIRGIIDVVVKDGQKPGTFRQILVPSGGGRFHFEPKTEV